jgi:hypothetical protein
MDDWVAGEQKRAILRNVAAYRELCRHVRRGSTSGLFFGAFMLAIWYFLFGQRQDYGAFSLIYLGLSCLEFTVALWNRLRPSAEGVLMDGLVLLVFGGATVVRQLLFMNGMLPGAQPSVIMLLFAALWLWQGVSHVKQYLAIRRSFAERPTAEHLRWFDGLLREVREADPTNDPDALDLPTRPPLRAKLLGDTALFLAPGSDDPLIVARNHVQVERAPAKDPDRDPEAYLVIEGDDFGRFRIDADNWRNYAKWKAEGGRPPGVGDS